MNIIEFLSSLKQESIINLITCLITVFASFITIFITISNANKNQNKAIQLQNNHFYRMLNEQEKIFNLTKEDEDLRNRISIMPYFKMVDDIKITEDNRTGDVIFEFPITLINIGNGTAINVTVEFKTDEEHRNIVYIDDGGSEKILYMYNSALFDNIVRCNEHTTFGICCYKHKLASQVFIKIKFQDMMHRTYEQEFFFIYQFGRYNSNVVRVESHTPIYK